MAPKWTDHFRRFFFLGIFGVFAVHTYLTRTFIPYPKWLNEEHKRLWREAGVDENQLKDGDLVLRHSRGFVSDAILSFSTREPEFSHSGIIRKIDGVTYVYHATGGEENVSNAMKRDKLALYCHPAAVFKFGVFRYDIPDDEMQEFLSILDEHYANKMEFDLDFAMETDDVMYCSEMIYKAMDEVRGPERNFLGLSKVGDKPYVAVDDLYLNDHTTELMRHEYQKVKKPDSEE